MCADHQAAATVASTPPHSPSTIATVPSSNKSLQADDPYVTSSYVISRTANLLHLAGHAPDVVEQVCEAMERSVEAYRDLSQISLSVDSPTHATAGEPAARILLLFSLKHQPPAPLLFRHSTGGLGDDGTDELLLMRQKSKSVTSVCMLM